MKLQKWVGSCLVILTALTALSLPAGAFGTTSDGMVYYNRQTTASPIMDKTTSKAMWSSYMGSNNNSVYNLAPAFHKRAESEGASKMPSYLTFGTYFTHESDSDTYDVAYDYRVEAPLLPAAYKGDLALSFVANLTNDRHWNWKRHTKTWVAYPTTWVQTENKSIIVHDTEDDGEGTETLGRGTFKPIGQSSGFLMFGAIGQACTCGSSEVSNIDIMLADTVGPRVKSIRAYRPETEGIYADRDTHFRAGDDVYIDMKFDEPIRFADDQAMRLADAPKLQLRIKRATDNVEQTGVSVLASLISLDNDTLTFRYTVPQSFSVNGLATAPDHLIYEVTPYQYQSTWNSTLPLFGLKLLAQTTGGAAKTTSRIVDLAGNPLEVAGSAVALKSPVHIDNVSPSVGGIEVAGMNQQATPGISDVYARLGQKLGFFVDFSEEMRFVAKSDHHAFEFDYQYHDDQSRVLGYDMQHVFAGVNVRLLAELNLAAEGKPVTAVAKYLTTVRDKASGRNVSRVYFETEEPVDATMQAIVYSAQTEGLPIGVNRIYSDPNFTVAPSEPDPSNYLFADASGNIWDADKRFIDAPASARLMPAQQLWLDTAAPTVTTGAGAADGGRYTPVTYPGSDDPTVFFFPVTVADPGDAQSGSNGVSGAFVWRDDTGNAIDYAYEYAVTSSADKPTDSQYVRSATGQKNAFTQLDSGNYIHIRLLSSVEYNIGASAIVVSPADNAGNAGEQAFAIAYELDQAPPKITRTSYRTEFVAGHGELTAGIEVRDVSEIATLEYQWTDQGSAPTADGWLTPTSPEYLSGTTANRKLLALVQSPLTPNVDYAFTLHIRAKDILGYESTASYDLASRLTLPKYSLTLANDPSALVAKHSAILSVPAADASLEPASQVLVLINRSTVNGEYWGRRFTAGELAGGVDIFDLGTNADGWTLVQQNDNAIFDATTPVVYGTAYVQTPLDATERAKLLAKINQGYGQVELTIIARRPDVDWDQNFWPTRYSVGIPHDEPIATSSYTFNFANPAAVGASDVIHGVEISPQSKVSRGSYYASSAVISSGPDALYATYPRNIDNAVFRIRVWNARTYSAFGLADIDFESPETRFAFYKTGDNASDAPLFTVPLTAAEYQNVAIPPGVATQHGSYRVVVSVKSKSTGHVDVETWDRIFIDQREIADVGVTSLTSRRNYQGGGYYTPSSATGYQLTPDERVQELWVSSYIGAQQSINFSVDGISPLTIGAETDTTPYIRVWNPGAGISEGYYSWIRLDTAQQSYFLYMFPPKSDTKYSQFRDNFINYILGTPYPTADGVAYVPVLPGDNEIHYEVRTASGYSSGDQTLIIHAVDAPPEIDIALAPALVEKDGGTQPAMIASVSALRSSAVAPETLQYGMGFYYATGPDAALVEDFKDGDVTLTKSGDYYFWVMDQRHNYGWRKVTVAIDSEAPALAVTDRSDSAKNTFGFEARVTDAVSTADSKLYIGFDDAYSAVLGVKPGTVFAVPEGNWTAADVSRSGVYEANTSWSGGAKIISFSGAFRYDTSVGAPGMAARTITLYAVDGAGNKSAVYTTTVTARNEPAGYVSGQVLPDGSFTATFNKPVQLMRPNETTLTPTYALDKGNAPFFANGTYQVEYCDIFGDICENSISINQFDALYNCTVGISETAPTNRDVTVLINAAFNEKVTLSLPASITNGRIELARDGLGAVVGATVTMSGNGVINYTVTPKDPAYPAKTFKLVVGNIDKTPPVVTQSSLRWVYTANVVDEIVGGKPTGRRITGGDVIVSLPGGEELLPLDGTDATHAFTLADQEPYTFRYSDLAGNRGSIIATLPATIVAKDYVGLDTTPPDYELAVYQSVSGASVKSAGYTRAEYEALSDKAAAFPVFSGALQLRFDVVDESQTTLSIKENPAPESVTVRGNTVTVGANASFTVVITDANNNVTEVPVVIANADNTPPTGKITYVKTGLYSIRGYLSVSDDRGGPVSIENTVGACLETAGEHAGQYYHEFLDNESFTFLFADAAGNKASAVAVVTTLDMTSPVITATEWVPFYVDADGNAQRGQLSDRPTNSDVSVYIRFSKPVDAITPAIVDGKGTLADVSITRTAESATVVFRQNAKVSLTFTAPNRRSGITTLEVNIIDKTAPVITTTRVDSAKSVACTFLANEPVLFEDPDSPTLAGEDRCEPGTSFAKTFDLNGDYRLRFTDLAGNSSVITVTVNTIDRTAPAISVTDLPATAESIKAYNDAHKTAIVHTLTNQPVTIQASMNEPGTISFRGVVHPATAGVPVPLTIDANGTYEIIATDLAGMTTRYQFRIDCVDRIPPQILLPGGTIPVRQGTSAEEFDDIALHAVLVSDNNDETPTLTHDRSKVDLAAAGVYPITYTARDSTGNQRTASFFVRVYDGSQLEVRVNGILTQPNDTLAIGGSGARVVSVTVGNLPGLSGEVEPYRMYWKAGLNTPGQMKSATPFSDSFTAPGGGFYTLYVMTQSRVDYITYVYLQP